MDKLARVLNFYGIPIESEKFKIVCPFHKDINASLLVDLKENRWKCFGCEKSGDAESFNKLMQHKSGKNDVQAVMVYNRIIKGTKDKETIERDDTPQYNKNSSQYLREAKDYYYGLKSVHWRNIEDEARYYMTYRGFKISTLQMTQAKLTYKENYPIIFPIMDLKRFKGWVCRTFDREVEKKRKYLYNKGFSRANTLAGNYDGKIVMVVEGYMDMLKARQFGVKKVCALLGWKATPNQIAKLKKQGVEIIISALDNDKCGKQGTRWLKDYFKVITFPYPEDTKDMGDMTEEKFKIAKKQIIKILQEEKNHGRNYEPAKSGGKVKRNKQR